MSRLHDVRVPAEGPKDADIFILGEGPGKEEAGKGRPFVGRAGKRLDKWLKMVGLNRSEIFISNVTKYLPKGKKKEFFRVGGEGPPTQVYMNGILEVLEEIKEVQPNVVVPLGNYALWAMCQVEKITRRRGSILESTLVEGQKVIPTIHPAWYDYSRKYEQENLSVWDFQRIKEQSAFPEIDLLDRTIITNPTPEEIHDAVDRFLQANLLTVDTEWYSPNEIAYIGFSDSPDYAVVMPATSMQAYRAYKKLLSSDVPKVMQNAFFDDVALHRIGIDVENVRHDSMVAWHYCWVGIPKGLEVITSVLTDIPFYSEELEFVGQGDETEGQIYCGKDCVGTQESMEKILDEEFKVTGARKGYEISMSIYDAFSEASKMGIRVDRNELNRLKDLYEGKLEELRDALEDVVGWRVNVGSWVQVAELVYDQLEYGKKRKSRSTAQDKIMDIAASESDPAKKEILTAVIRMRRLRKLLEVYVKDGIVDRDGRVRTNWNLAGTKSGRLSATIPWWPGIALQTVPGQSAGPYALPGARTFYVPDPGHVFLGWDLEQAEARYVAMRTGDYELLDNMEAGIDIHVKLASMLPFGKSYEEIMAMVKEQGKDEVAERVLSKTVRHATNYKETWFGLKRTVNREYLDTGVGIDAATAKTLNSSYLEINHYLPTWWEEVKTILYDRGYLENALGRRRKWLGKLGKKEHREAISWEPQSAIADVTTTSIAACWEEVEWFQPLIHSHDGGVAQVPEEMEDDGIELIKKHMTRELFIEGKPLTIPVEVKRGYSWGDLKEIQ